MPLQLQNGKVYGMAGNGKEGGGEGSLGRGRRMMVRTNISKSRKTTKGEGKRDGGSKWPPRGNNHF